MYNVRWCLRNIYLIFPLFFIDINSIQLGDLTCGVDKSNLSIIYPGIADMQVYPWMGMLYYPVGKQIYTSVVVLVTRQLAMASATEIDRLPKEDFRKTTRVVIGTQCGGRDIGIRDYSYHPDYMQNTYSALAIVQLETDHIAHELHPICPPPTHLIHPELYAMTVSNDCKNANLRLFKMQYVELEECQSYYRRAHLDVDSFWPSYATCARAVTGGKCMWRSGTALVIKQGGHWRLLGFGVYGPGCEAPARFLDYGMYQKWVETSVSRMGLPAITRLDSNHIVMRRKMSSIQKFGPCDKEELRNLIYEDKVYIIAAHLMYKTVYNMSLYTTVEYSCITFKAFNVKNKKRTYRVTTPPPHNYTVSVTKPMHRKPRIYLRRWCAGPQHVCYGWQFLEIHFNVEIYFSFDNIFIMKVYGKPAAILDPTRVMEYSNNINWKKPPLFPYSLIMDRLRYRGYKDNFWFYLEDYNRKRRR